MSISDINKNKINEYFNVGFSTQIEQSNPVSNRPQITQSEKNISKNPIMRNTKQVPTNTANHTISNQFFSGFGQKDVVEENIYIRDEDDYDPEAFIEQDGELIYNPIVLRNR